MQVRGMILAAVALALAGSAAAQQAAVPAPGSLSPLAYACPGTEPALLTGKSMNGMISKRRMRASAGRMSKGMGGKQTRALLEVVVDGPAVRVRPPPGSTPSIGRSPDGWYVLADVALDEAAIQGQAPYGLLAKPKLAIDRRTGEVSYGEFRGKCRLKRPRVETAAETETAAKPAPTVASAETPA